MLRYDEIGDQKLRSNSFIENYWNPKCIETRTQFSKGSWLETIKKILNG